MEDQIDKYSDAWEKGKDALEEEFGIRFGQARPPSPNNAYVLTRNTIWGQRQVLIHLNAQLANSLMEAGIEPAADIVLDLLELIPGAQILVVIDAIDIVLETLFGVSPIDEALRLVILNPDGTMDITLTDIFFINLCSIDVGALNIRGPINLNPFYLWPLPGFSLIEPGWFFSI